MRRRRSSAVAMWGLVAVLSLTAVAACSNSTPTPPKAPVGILGTITSSQRGSDALPYTVLVEGGKQPDGALSDKAMVTIGEETTVVGRDGRRVARDSLRVGMTVKVWFTGPVAESYPIQGGAAFVQVVR